MLASTKLENKVKDSLQKRLPPKADGEAVGFDFISLLMPLIIELIAKLTEGCLNKNKGDKAKVATNMMRDNLLTRAVIREGVSRSNIPRDHHAVSREVVVDVMAGNTKDDVLQWIDESDSTMPDWSMF